MFFKVTLLVFQIFIKCLLKRHFLNCLADVEKTILYLGLLFKLHFLDFFNFFIICRKVPLDHSITNTGGL